MASETLCILIFRLTAVVHFYVVLRKGVPTPVGCRWLTFPESLGTRSGMKFTRCSLHSESGIARKEWVTQQMSEGVMQVVITRV